MTLPVMTVLSADSPVPSCFAVEAQPSAVAMSSTPARARVADLRVTLVLVFHCVKHFAVTARDYKRPIKNSTITISNTTPTIPLGP